MAGMDVDMGGPHLRTVAHHRSCVPPLLMHFDTSQPSICSVTLYNVYDPLDGRDSGPAQFQNEGISVRSRERVQVVNLCQKRRIYGPSGRIAAPAS